MAPGVLKKRQEEMEKEMLIGAAIAGLLIVSLFLEMVTSSPKPSKEPVHRLPAGK